MAFKVFLDPNYKGSDIILSDDKMSAELNVVNKGEFVRATHGAYSGSWYWEYQLNEGKRVCPGIVSEDGTDVNQSAFFTIKDSGTHRLVTGSGIQYWAFDYNTGVASKGTVVATDNINSSKNKTDLETYTTTDIIGFHLDMNNKQLSVYKNGTFIYTQTNIPSNKMFYPSIGIYTASRISTGEAALSGKGTFNFGESPFKYPIPNGTKPYYLVATEQYTVTLDSDYKGSDIALSDDKMTAELSEINKSQFIRATHGTNNGSWYWEYIKQDNGWSGPGIISIDGIDKNNCCVFQSNNDGGSYRILSGSGLQYLAWKWDNIGQPYGTVISTDDINPEKRAIVDIYNKDDIIGFHLDMNTKTLTMYKNGVFVYTQNNIPDKTFFPGLGVGTAFSASSLEKYCKGTFNFGESPFKHSIPNGAKPYYLVATKQYTVTLDPNYKGSNMVLSDDKMIVDLAVKNKSQFIRATHGTYSGSWYWEYEKLDDGERIGPGIVSKDGTNVNSTSVFLTNNDGGKYRLLSGSGIQYAPWSTNATLKEATILLTDDIYPGKRISGVPYYTIGDVIGFHLDMNNKQLSLYKNNVLVHTQNNIPYKIFYPAIGITTVESSAWNKPYGKGKFNFGETSFKYPIPSGAKPYYQVKDLIEDLKIY